MGKDYTYAVARIRGKELALFGGPVMEQLLACKTCGEALRFLADKGWGNPDKALTAENLLEEETKKTWDLISEMVKDMSVFDVFRIADDYHNLKAALKLVYVQSGISRNRVFVTGGRISPEIIEKAARERDFSSLSVDMQKAAEEAQGTLLHTGDGQLCDIILDRASLEAVYQAGVDSREEVLKRYAQLTVAAADIRIAVRCGKVGKSLDFIERALAPCPGLDTEALAHAALSGTESVASCLERTEYAAAAEALRKSPAAFEKWCDDLIIEEIRPQKYNPFTLGPLAAYILARRNEIKCVRMILTGRQNELPDNVIRERLREMYV